MLLSPTEILAEDGPVADLIDGFTARREQQALAESITAAIANQESLICEAGTGTGKTFAYLVPAILSGARVIISTGTKHLQDQLFRRDLPARPRDAAALVERDRQPGVRHDGEQFRIGVHLVREQSRESPDAVCQRSGLRSHGRGPLSAR